MSRILRTLQRLEEARLAREAAAAPPTPRFDPLELARLDEAPEAARLLPVASGKGGVGKTNFSVSLALALAERLRGGPGRVVLVDADFGLPNADLVLGVRPAATLDDLAAKRVASLAETAAETGHPNLRFVGGAENPSAALANLDYRTRRRFRRNVEALEAAYVVLDLGAGASDEVVDFVSMTNAAIVVTTPEPPARRDAFLLVKNALLRRLAAETRPLEAVGDRLRRLEAGDGISSVPDLLLSLREDRHAVEEKIVREIVGRFRPRIVVNRVEDEAEAAACFSHLEDRCRHELGVRPESLGWIPDDRAVVEAVKAGRPFLFHAPDSDAARALLAVAGRVAGEEAFAFDRNYFSFAEYVRRVFRRH